MLATHRLQPNTKSNNGRETEPVVRDWEMWLEGSTGSFGVVNFLFLDQGAGQMGVFNCAKTSLLMIWALFCICVIGQ